MTRVGILNLDRNQRSEEIISSSMNVASLPATKGREACKRFLADHKYDAIAVVGSGRKKAEFAERALLSGKHVLIDFPASHKLEETQRLHDTAVEKKLCLFSPNLMRTELGLPELREAVSSGTSRLLSLTITYGAQVSQGVRQFSMKLMQLLDLVEWLANSRQREVLSHENMAGKSPQACIVLLSMGNGVRALVNLYSISSSSKERFWADGIFEDSITHINPYAQSLRLSHSGQRPEEDVEWGQSSLSFAMKEFLTQISERKIMNMEQMKRMFELRDGMES